MQSPTPQPPDPPAPNRAAPSNRAESQRAESNRAESQRAAVSIRADIDAGLSDHLAAVVAGARRRAHRDGDGQIDTAHLLHSLVESDPEVRAAFGSGPQVARVLGYLVQRSIGYGLRWQGTVEDSGTVPAVAAPGVPGWSPAAVISMEGARERAALRGAPHARGIDLLAALASDHACRAVEVLERAGVSTRLLTGRIAEGSSPGVSSA